MERRALAVRGADLTRACRAGNSMDGWPNRIDPDKWRPLIMSFQKFYGLASGQVHD